MHVRDITISPALEPDLAAIFDLLEKSHLPTEGLAEHVSSMLIARDRDTIVGCAALEIYGKQALLRSVAVDESIRGQGWGKSLTCAALDLANTLGISEVYLLTETATTFFPRFGFTMIARSDVPANVRQSVEFATACPDSAIAMARH